MENRLLFIEKDSALKLIKILENDKKDVIELKNISGRFYDKSLCSDDYTTVLITQLVRYPHYHLVVKTNDNKVSNIKYTDNMNWCVI